MKRRIHQTDMSTASAPIIKTMCGREAFPAKNISSSPYDTLTDCLACLRKARKRITP